MRITLIAEKEEENEGNFGPETIQMSKSNVIFLNDFAELIGHFARGAGWHTDHVEFHIGETVHGSYDYDGDLEGFYETED